MTDCYNFTINETNKHMNHCLDKCIQNIDINAQNAQIKKILSDIYKKDIQKNQIYMINDDVIYIKNHTCDTETYFENDNKSIYLFSDNEKAIENKCINRVILRSQPFSTKYEVSGRLLLNQ